MTEPSQYFKGRTVQEQMNEVIGYVDTRAAEVATDAIASDVAQVHQDMLDADADASAAAASAAAAAGTLANAVKKTGEASQSIAGDIAVSGDLSAGGDLAVTGAITGDDGTFTGVVTVPTPVNNTDAANKKYVDDADALKVSITDINTYAVGLTGNQSPITGLKSHVSNNCWEAVNANPSNGFICKSSADDVTAIPAAEIQYPMVVWKDKNDQTIAMLRLEHKTSGQVFMMLYLKNTNGIAGFTNKELARNQIV